MRSRKYIVETPHQVAQVHGGELQGLTPTEGQELADETLADRVIFCFCDGYGTDWAARAGMNHWRIRCVLAFVGG